VTDLFAWQLNFTYDPTQLNVTRAVQPTTDPDYVFYNCTGPSILLPPSYYVGSVIIGHALTPDPNNPPFNGSGKLLVITLEIIATPPEQGSLTSDLIIDTIGAFHTRLVDPNGEDIPFTTTNGVFSYTWVLSHNVAVSDVIPSKNIAGEGSIIYVIVTVENQGSFNETLDLTTYANTTIIDTQTISLTNGSSTTVTFTWNTTGWIFGSYLLWAEAGVVEGELYTDDNTLIDGAILIEPSIHDVAVTDVTVSPNFAYTGENVSVFVDAMNIGPFPETFNVTAYADENLNIVGDEIIIGNQSVSLPPKGSITLTLTWNTKGVSPGNYRVGAIASNVTQEADSTDNLYINGEITLFDPLPCYDLNITSPTYIELNPSIFQFNQTLTALQVSLGNMTIDSTGYEGSLRVLGSTNNTVHLHVDQPHLEFAVYYMPQNGSIKIPLWLLFDPGTYSGIYELQLTVCGTHRLNITVKIVHLWICQNGAYSVEGGTVTFNWTLTGGSWVYLEAQPELPPGWSFTVNPPIGTLFETPHQIIVNITAASDAKEGDIGSVTLRAYKNETKILIWQYTFFTSVDNKPPTIEAIQPPTLTLTGDLLFNATVSDSSGIESVRLCYSVNSGPWNNETMRWDSGDTFNSTSYTLTIPHVPDNSTIQYYIVATDWLGNQTQSDTQTTIVKYDSAISKIRTAKTVVFQGFVARINVTVANQGTIPNTLLKTFIYANTSTIHTQIIPFLRNGTSTNLMFYWNTSDLPKGSYKISAFVVPLTGETDTADNTLSDNWIIVSMMGDISGPDGVPDGLVDIDDVIPIALAYASILGDPRYHPNIDLNDDGLIDIDDVIIPAIHYGTIDP
jgi:hypothetical protein